MRCALESQPTSPLRGVALGLLLSWSEIPRTCPSLPAPRRPHSLRVSVPKARYSASPSIAQCHSPLLSL